MQKLVFLSLLNKFLSIDGNLYTEEDLNYLDDLETKWKASLPKYSFTELMKIFPEAIAPARRGLKNKIKEYKEKLKEIDRVEERYQNNRINKAHFSEQAELKKIADKDFHEYRNFWISKIKTAMFNLSHLDELEGKRKPQKTNGVTEDEIAQAKQVPIETFYTGKLKGEFGLCPFHSEKSPSFKIYRSQNTWWCFSCNTGGSVVDYLMKLNNVDFLTAVRQLLLK